MTLLLREETVLTSVLVVLVSASVCARGCASWGNNQEVFEGLHSCVVSRYMEHDIQYELVRRYEVTQCRYDAQMGRCGR